MSIFCQRGFSTEKMISSRPASVMPAGRLTSSQYSSLLMASSSSGGGLRSGKRWYRVQQSRMQAPAHLAEMAAQCLAGIRARFRDRMLSARHRGRRVEQMKLDALSLIAVHQPPDDYFFA